MAFLNPDFQTSHSDAIVIGGGPVGSFVALQLSKAGVKTTVYEEHPEVGVPSHCAGHISIRSLKNMGLYPLPKGIEENTFCSANFYSSYGTKFRLSLSCPVTVAVNRACFDHYLAEQAQKAGANYVLNARVQSLLVNNGFVKGVKIKKANGVEEKFFSKVVIDAEGISSRLLHQAGLRTKKPIRILYTAEAEITNIFNCELNAVEVYFGKKYAPGFYAWLIPRRDGSAKLGLATNSGNPLEYLKRLMAKHPVASKQLAKAEITRINYHAISLSGPIPKSYTNGFLAVGDCASQVKPTTGGGVIFGLSCAKIAAQVASSAIENGDVSAEFLKIYQQRCRELTNLDFGVMLRLRRFLDSLSDDKLDEMLRVCQKLGVDKALRDVDEIDFQGKMLLAVLRKPAVAAAFLYFGLLYLSTNP
jgi:digeranylgeranylglycerophospholipid reductase